MPEPTEAMKLTAKDDPETIKRYGHIRPARAWRTKRCSAKRRGVAGPCTLARGHRGPHVAHGRFGKVVAVWDSGTAAQRSSEAIGRVSEARAGTGLGRRKPVGVIRDSLRWVGRAFSSIEEIALGIMLLAFVWFAIDWLMLIFR